MAFDQSVYQSKYRALCKTDPAYVLYRREYMRMYMAMRRRNKEFRFAAKIRKVLRDGK